MRFRCPAETLFCSSGYEFSDDLEPVRQFITRRTDYSNFIVKDWLGLFTAILFYDIIASIGIAIRKCAAE
jgi:hypothetical protein